MYNAPIYIYANHTGGGATNAYTHNIRVLKCLLVLASKHQCMVYYYTRVLCARDEFAHPRPRSPKQPPLQIERADLNIIISKRPNRIKYYTRPFVCGLMRFAKPFGVRHACGCRRRLLILFILYPVARI